MQNKETTRKTTAKYFALFPTSHGDGAILSCVPAEGPKSNKYLKARPIKDLFPKAEDAIMCFDPNYKQNTKLYDILDCLDGILVVNKKVQQLFEKEGAIGEFLPVKIWDHDDSLVSEDYAIFNHLEQVELIDMEQSNITMNTTFPDRVQRITQLAVRKDIVGNPKIFCPTNMKNQLFISEDFKNSLTDAGITGFKTFEAEGWDGLNI